MDPHPFATLYVALYACLGFGGVIGLTFGTSQLSLGMQATALWIVPLVLVLGALVHSTAWVGQRLSREQMTRLRAVVDEALARCAK